MIPVKSCKFDNSVVPKSQRCSVPAVVPDRRHLCMTCLKKLNQSNLLPMKNVSKNVTKMSTSAITHIQRNATSTTTNLHAANVNFACGKNCYPVLLQLG